ncbi:hypothetical protein C8F04DRAFT_1237363 [Mycena alexandri]|uniref:Secreted protein n=1 Tax=Mycena alexandri TaxID=1745969 RepID=A0AAD6SJG4_9AGAR|nr:hypothetical protein C8F04DRAFT_1237363 [Mycena alexandri]
MRFSAALLLLSGAMLATAQCSICPEEVKNNEREYPLEAKWSSYYGPSQTTFCSYAATEKDNRDDRGFCLFNGTGGYVYGDMTGCPTQVKVKKCKNVDEESKI